MATVYMIGVIPESDFPLFSRLCIHSMVGDSYADHLEILENQRKELRAMGAKPIDTAIDAAGFQVWLHGRIATPTDLCQYANCVYDQKKANP